MARSFGDEVVRCCCHNSSRYDTAPMPPHKILGLLLAVKFWEKCVDSTFPQQAIFNCLPHTLSTEEKGQAITAAEYQWEQLLKEESSNEFKAWLD